MPTETFGQALRRLRVAEALTQERLAEYAGISAAAIAALEAGRRTTPRLSTVAVLADALKLDDPTRSALLATLAPAEAAGATPLATAGATSGARTGATPHATSAVATRTFVGRTSAIAELRAARDAGVRLTLVTGEAGIGKTRLAREFTASLAAGVTVLWGRCTEETLGVYDPFVAVLRGALERTRASAPGAPVAGLGELRRLLPELDGAGGPETRADGAIERRFLFEAAAALLAATAPAVVVVDDLHWADRSTHALLGYLVEQGPDGVTLIATLRTAGTDPALMGELGELARRATQRRVDLEGLARDDVDALVQAVAGGPVSNDVVAAIVRTTDGNPFFVEELTEHLAARDALGGSLVAEAFNSDVPIRVRDTIRRRAAGLAPATRQMLDVGSVLGREFDPYFAVSLAGDVDVVASTEDALLSGFVEEIDDGRIAFTHALVQNAFHDDMSRVRRVAIHRRVAESLAANVETLPTAAEVARHWAVVAAVDTSFTAEAARWAVVAGDAASAGAAHDESIIWYEQAAQLWNKTTAEHADTLVRLGTALYTAGQDDEARRRFADALALARQLDDGVLLGRAALGYAAPLAYGRVDTESIAVLEESIARTDDGIVRPALASMLMRHLAFDRSPAATARRDELVNIVIDATLRPDAPDELFLVLSDARDTIPIEEAELLDGFSRRVVAIASRRRHLVALANGWYQHAWSAMERADGAALRTAVHEYRENANRMRSPHELAVAEMLDGALSLLEGRYADADAHITQIRTWGHEAGDANLSIIGGTQAWLAALDRGDAVSEHGRLGRSRTQSALGTVAAARALTATMAGDADAALAAIDAAATAGLTSIRFDSEWLGTIALFADACVRCEMRDHAGELTDLLEGARARGVRIAPISGWWGPLDHHLGGLARVSGRTDDALAHLERALEIGEAMGAVPFAARTAIELARTHSTVLGGDRGRADMLLARAEADATRVGAFGIAAEARAARAAR